MTAAHVDDVVWERAAALHSLRAEVDDNPVVESAVSAIEAKIAEADEALLELASLEMRRALREDWAPAMRRLREEKDELLRELDRAAVVAPGATRIDFDELDEADREIALRGAISAIFVRRMPRGSAPDDRVHVLWKGDPLPRLGGPRDRIPPTRFEFPEATDDDAAVPAKK